MTIAVYPGSFDPVTNGHLDIIERSSKIFDRLIIGVLHKKKKKPLFSLEEREEIISHCVSHLKNVEVRSFQGLTVDFARECGSNVIIRGLRAVTDFEYELQLSQTNRTISPQVDTLFLNTDLQYSYLSSSIVKEIALYRGDLSALVPQYVEEKIRAKYEEISRQEVTKQ